MKAEQNVRCQHLHCVVPESHTPGRNKASLMKAEEVTQHLTFLKVQIRHSHGQCANATSKLWLSAATMLTFFVFKWNHNIRHNKRHTPLI